MSKRKRTSLGGCVFSLTMVLFACALLVVNGVFVSLFYEAVHNSAMAWLDDDKYAQGVTRGVMFIGPVIFLVFQWWLWDRFVDWFARDASRQAKRGKVKPSRFPTPSKP